MKNLVLLMVMIFAAVSLSGCGKKKKDDLSSMEGLNGVASENVISVTDDSEIQINPATEVPVVVDNADMMEGMVINDIEQVAAEAGAVIAKPEPKQIQQALKNAGVYTGKVDGDIGPRTKKAIEAFQAQHGLKADGKVGVKTWKVLSEYLNRSTEVVNPTEDVQAIGQ